jgi:hypothetical protein
MLVCINGGPLPRADLQVPDTEGCIMARSAGSDAHTLATRLAYFPRLVVKKQEASIHTYIHTYAYE